MEAVAVIEIHRVFSYPSPRPPFSSSRFSVFYFSSDRAERDKTLSQGPEDFWPGSRERTRIARLRQNTYGLWFCTSAGSLRTCHAVYFVFEVNCAVETKQLNVTRNSYLTFKSNLHERFWDIVRRVRISVFFLLRGKWSILQPSTDDQLKRAKHKPIYAMR